MVTPPLRAQRCGPRFDCRERRAIFFEDLTTSTSDTLHPLNLAKIRRPRDNTIGRFVFRFATVLRASPLKFAVTSSVMKTFLGQHNSIPPTFYQYPITKLSNRLFYACFQTKTCVFFFSREKVRQFRARVRSFYIYIYI